MPSLPPSLTLKIPSLHDSKLLQTRIYLPGALKDIHLRDEWCRSHKRLAIIAHPYAPLGGNFNDRVVISMMRELVELGWAVGTFNFRGASGSEGRTSWTGKPEIGDYEAVVGGLLGFVDSLRPITASDIPTEDAGGSGKKKKEISLLIAGYSYGSLIASHLPAYEELAKEVDSRIQESREYRTCMAGLRGSGQSWGMDKNPSTKVGEQTPDTLEISNIPIRPSYLLISPLLPPVSGLLTLSMFSSASTSSIMSEELGAKIRGRVLVVHGDGDVFTSAAKYLKWKEKWVEKSSAAGSDSNEDTQANESREVVKVTGAGHFWIEDGVMEELVQSVRDWVAEGEGM